MKENLRVFIDAAKMRQETLDHVLYTYPGLGKTTLASIVHNEMGVEMRTTSYRHRKTGRFGSHFDGARTRDVLFIDEIHRLNRSIEEVLYPAMEDFCLDIVIGKAVRPLRPSRSSPFTLVGATTRVGLLTAPLRDRFGVLSRLEYYTQEELTDIVSRTADVFEVDIEKLRLWKSPDGQGERRGLQTGCSEG